MVALKWFSMRGFRLLDLLFFFIVYLSLSVFYLVVFRGYLYGLRRVELRIVVRCEWLGKAVEGVVYANVMMV